MLKATLVYLFCLLKHEAPPAKPRAPQNKAGVQPYPAPVAHVGCSYSPFILPSPCITPLVLLSSHNKIVEAQDPRSLLISRLFSTPPMSLRTAVRALRNFIARKT